MSGPAWQRALTPAKPQAFDWESASDEAFWHRIENMRYRPGDRNNRGEVLTEGHPDIGRQLLPDARQHDREYWEDYFLKRGQFAVLARLSTPPVKCLWFDDVADWGGIKVPPRRWLLEGWLPIGEAALLTGAGSIGKSLVSQQLAVTIAAGKPFMGLTTEQAKTLYVTCEDSREELQRRHQAIADRVGSPMAGNCLVTSWKGEPDLELATFDGDRRLLPTRRFNDLRESALDIGMRFIVLDNTSHLMGGDENVKREVAAFVNLMNGLAAEIDGVVLLLGHPNKTGLNKPDAGDANQFGGSVSWENQVRSRMFMAATDENDPDARELSNPKANYSAKGNKLQFRWHRGAYVRQEDLPTDYAAELSATIRASAENDAFLACLRARMKVPGREVGPSSGPNYAPARFAEMTEAKGLKKDKLARAMERLFHIGAIETRQVKRKGSDTKNIIVEASEPTSEPLPTMPSEQVRTPVRTVPRTYSTTNVVSGAATQAAAPSDADKPGPVDGAASHE